MQDEHIFGNLAALLLSGLQSDSVHVEAALSDLMVTNDSVTRVLRSATFDDTIKTRIIALLQAFADIKV